MIRKISIFSLILLIGFAFCLTNIHADNGEANNAVPDDFQRVPNFILGGNDIEYMEDLPEDSEDYILGRKVAFLVIGKGPGRRPDCCTGFLISPDLLMTNDHCIRYDKDDPSSPFVPAHDIRVYMEFYHGNWSDSDANATVERILHTDPEKDYALLKLNWPIGWDYGWLGLDNSPVDTSQSVKIIHHSNCERKQISRRNSRIVDPSDYSVSAPGWILAYLADTEGGASGSPVFLRGGNRVVAINHSGKFRRDGSGNITPLFNQGTLMSWIWPEISRWHPKTTTFDLFVESPRVSKVTLSAGEQFTFSITVGNRSPLISHETTLKFYRSRGSNIYEPITTRDLGPMSPSSSGRLIQTMTAPTAPGTYRYIACIDKSRHDSDHDNNCSDAVEITVSPRPISNLIYWTGEGKIQRAHSDGFAQDIVTGLSYPKGIALDVAGAKIYWTDHNTSKIQRANLDGTDVEDIVTGLSRPNGIALDVAGGKFYWSDWAAGKIKRANLDGSAVEDIVTELNYPESLSHPVSIAVDVVNRKIYWINLMGPRGLNPPGNGNIWRANFDGTNVENILTGLDMSVDSNIALDVAGAKMYWIGLIGRSDHEIRRANLDGTNIEGIFTQSHKYVTQIALDVLNRKIYWTAEDAAGDGLIGLVNFDGSQGEELLMNLPRAYGIAFGIQHPRGTIAFNPSEIADQTFTVGTPVSLTLPEAIGGTAPYFYILEPQLPDGLYFDPIGDGPGYIGGTPTTVTPPTLFTYAVRDAMDASALLNFTIEVIEDAIGPDPLDVNGDGQVTVIDLAVVALFYGTQVPAGVSLPADVNADGVVNLLDLTAIAQAIDATSGGANGLSLRDVEAVLLAVIALDAVAEAPMGFGTSQHILSGGIAYGNVATALVDVKHLAISDVLSELLHLLAEMGAIPETTALLPNYPNPFNPETWIPYHLATDADVTLTIYDMRGVSVRQLVLGHQPAGVYASRARAVYWDGRNELGEPVASGMYFYTLTAGNFTATRKLLIAK